MKSERINLGKINTHNVTGTAKVVSFEVVPASFAYHVWFNLQKTSVFVDYKSMIKHMDAMTP
jgi:ribosomal 30S subunit maturation factor RimM